MPVSDVISALNGHKFLYIDFNMRSWASNSSSAYWYSDLFSGESRLTGSFSRKATGIVVSETDIATISLSGASSGYYTFTISARSSNGYVVTGNMTGNIAMNFTLNIYSA